MNLTIDIGNTWTKLVVFDPNGTPCADQTVRMCDMLPAVQGILGQYLIERCAVCSVAKDDESVKSSLDLMNCPILWVTGNTPVPFPVAYQSRNTLGADRLAAVVGGVTLYPNRNVLVVDAGTCVTYDLFTIGQGYVGGNISPGIKMRLKAMHEMTARLPIVSKHGDAPEVGYDTESAIRAGAIQGLQYEIEGYVSYWRNRFPDLVLLFAGGNSRDLLDFERIGGIHERLLVSVGLNRLLQ